MKEIDLSQFTSQKSMVLSGRERGVEVRAKLNFNQLDNADIEASVSVPDHIISLNSSFFQGLFGDSVRTLGEEGFRRKYQFKCTSVITEDVDKGIVDALNHANPLS
jgi:hypothetical protein